MLRGKVTLAETGDPIDGAVVLLLGTGAFTFTDGGSFEIANVPAGSYVVTAQREHLTTVQQDVTVVPGKRPASTSSSACRRCARR